MSWLLLPVIAKLWVMQDYNLLYFLYRRLSKCCFPNSHVDKLDLFLRIFWNLPSLREQIVCIRIHGIFCPLSLQDRRKSFTIHCVLLRSKEYQPNYWRIYTKLLLCFQNGFYSLHYLFMRWGKQFCNSRKNWRLISE